MTKKFVMKRSEYALRQYGQYGWKDLQVWPDEGPEGEAKELAKRACAEVRLGKGAGQWCWKVVYRQEFEEEVY